MKKFKVVELFAGAGGLALGLEKAGLETIGLVEIDKKACETLKINRPNWNVINEDIVKLSEKNLEDYFSIKRGNLDLLSGGFPCQSFSYAGERKGLEDARGTMFYYYAVFLKKLYPKVFIAENVKGLVNHDKGKTLDVMLRVFSEIGYTVQYKVLNAWEHNVAQKRERIFIVGIRNDQLGKIKFNFPEKEKIKPVLRDVLIDVPESPGKKYNDYKKTIMDMVPQGGSWVNLPKDVAIEYMKGSYYLGGGKRGMARRLSLDEPSLTLTTSPDMKQTERCHPLFTRPLTTREYARIQSFPDSWIFVGSINNVYKQIGNAVPVNLAFRIAESIVKALEGKG